MTPKTLLELAGASPAPVRLADAVVVVVDAQHEYVDGALPLAGIDPALDELGRLLALARREAVPVIHVVHHGKGGGGPFTPGTRGVEIVAPAAPAPGEPVLTKSLPNAFASTDLADRLHALHRSSVVLAGFMTHMCIEATARGAIDLGIKAAVIAGATATRDLRDPLSGAVIPAHEVHRNALAALADRFATIVSSCDGLSD